MGEYTKRRFMTLICARNKYKKPIKSKHPGKVPTVERSRPTLEPTTRRRWREGLVRGHPTPHQCLSVTPSYGGCMESC
jgi:hypothetical protein